ncbi:MAG TPA: putative lipid II flippase FtsW [Bacilli bacterium]|nr:putative lipid II flippase FtsW [Bacilli bacterium]
MLRKYRNYLFLAVILLVIIGLVMIYSSSYIWAEYKYGDALKFVKQQSLFIVIGFILMYIVNKINYKIYYEKANLILIICLFLLILVLIPGIGTIRNGSRSWFGIGSFGIQPSEFAKFALIIFVSKYLSKSEKVGRNIKKILSIFLVVGIFFLLIMLQPDFGTGMVIVLSIISLIFASGVNFKYFYYLIGSGIIGITGLILVAPYRMKRIISFINPWADPLGSGFQIIQSLYAIGPGGLFGVGFLNSRQKHFYLPEPQTDFIFSIICEEFGIIGAIVVLGLFTIIVFAGINIALKQDNLFAKYLAYGITFQIIFQAVLNLCVVVGIVPVTGYAMQCN